MSDDDQLPDMPPCEGETHCPCWHSLECCYCGAAERDEADE
jgi:hypothetical protein